MKKIIITSIFLVTSSLALSCENKKESSYNYSDNIQIWLGNNSEFSKAYKNGKCALDKVLKDLPASQKKVLASLIARSYNQEILDKNNKSELSF